MACYTRLYLLAGLFLFLFCVSSVAAADCKYATVGQPDSTCYDIYTRAKITQAQLLSYNPGLDCSRIQPGQRLCISSGTLPSTAPQPSQNGTCYTYYTKSGDDCYGIGTKFTITTAQIEEYNKKTWKWKGCSALQANFPMCVSSGNPPPIPIIPGLQCGPQSQGNKTCPLNACCSGFGYCGLTDEFCSTKGSDPCISNCGQPELPSCSPSGLGQSLAYYAGWGDRRACGKNVSPSQIDWNGYNAVNFAFATMSQGQAIQISDQDVPLLKELVAEKKRFSGMKVLIALGGWAFSEEEPTRDLFSVMISTSTNRATFIKSVQKFLSDYGLDGIDIDFEYPGAIERNAPATDTPNLTSFFKELRTALPSAVISIATPAGYWFLKGFEIDKIASQVDYINMMSYDYHGQWDTNVAGQASVSNPHTSLKDMEDSVRLYLRAKIPLSKVNLGLAWYGRSYTLANTSCRGYNCSMTGGGFAGDCTLAPGYLAQFEIDDILRSGNQPTFDKNSQTYWIVEKGSLISFDQEQTWNSKKDFAASRCFRGTFVWSVDQRTDNLSDDSGGGSDGGSGGAGRYNEITWNPNPHPPANAKSETFVQSAGTYPTVITSVITGGTSVITQTITNRAVTSTKTLWTTVKGTPTQTVVTTTTPASTYVETRTVTGQSVRRTSTVLTLASTTVVVSVPTSTRTVTVGGATLTLAPGGTPVNSQLPTWVSLVSGITPKWTYQIIPPTNASTVTFTAPLTSTPTWTSTVRVPPRSSDPPATVTGPPGSKDDRCDNGSNIFELLWNHVIDGCVPPVVGIRGGVTPTPIKPPGWTGKWPNPHPLPTGPPGSDPDDPEDPDDPDDEDPDEDEFCIPGLTTPPYELSPDPENVGDDRDQDEQRRRAVRSLVELSKKEEDAKTTILSSLPEVSNLSTREGNHSLERRAGERHIRVGSPQNTCVEVVNSVAVTLGAGQYLTVGRQISSNINLQSSNVGSKPPTTNPQDVIQEHIFELQYINEFFSDYLLPVMGCQWIKDNVFDAARNNGGNLGEALLDAIDTTDNMVWADRPMNQAKSNVVNNNRGALANPPQQANVDRLNDFVTDRTAIYNLELFVRSFAALGQYFATTSGTFRATAKRVQDRLSEITPNTVPDNSQSIPMMFNRWLTGVVRQYPSGCTTRAENALGYYKEKMELLADEEQISVPTCFPLYHTYSLLPLNPSSFTYQNLIPAFPNHPGCNVPGTQGEVGFFAANSNTFVSLSTFQRVMGAGNTDYYAMGSGDRLAPGESRWRAIEFNSLTGTTPSQCANAYAMADFDPSAGQGPQVRSQDAQVAFSCGGNTGKRNANFGFVHANGQGLSCAKYEVGHAGGTTYTIICAVSQRTALDCATAAAAGSGGNVQNVQMAFRPS